jgi:hypothetical protein
MNLKILNSKIVNRKLNNSLPTGALPREIAQLISSGPLLHLPNHSPLVSLLSTLFKFPYSTRPQRPIIFWPFSTSLIAINLYQKLITIYKPITYVTIIIFTNVKNIRQIRLFMQNKPKVKIGKIDKIRPVLSEPVLSKVEGVEWADSRFCVGRKFNDNSL